MPLPQMLQTMMMAIVDGGAGEGQTDGDDDGTRHNRREEAHYFLGAESCDERCQHEIDEPCAEHSDASVGKGMSCVKTLLGTHCNDRSISAEESEG